MKKTVLFLSAIAFVISSCTKYQEDTDLANNSVSFSLSVNRGEDTKALAESGANLSKTFAENDKIAVVYVVGGETKVAESAALEPADIESGSKQATFKITLEGTPDANSAVKLIYPSSMANADGSVNYAALATQDGTLDYIAANLDLGLYEGTLSGTTLPANATLTNPLVICKFTVKNFGVTDITGSITSFNVNEGTNTYSISRTAAAGPIWTAIQPVSGADVSFSASNGITTYEGSVKGKTLAAGKLYPINLTMAAPFSVSSTQKVIFSHGNLQATYNSVSWSWAFAEHQYSFIDNTSGNTAISTSVKETSEPYAKLSTTNGTVDLFGWSTAATYYGIASSVNENSLYSGEFVDWGNLTIGNTAPNTWRTLSGGDNGEWKYLLETRSASTVGGTENARYLKARVNSDATAVKGLIIFPDVFTWNTATMGTAPTTCNTANDEFSHSLTTAQWDALEAAGAVFLPGAGCRSGNYVTDRQNTEYAAGYYWANGQFNDESAKCLLFTKGSVNANGKYAKSYGRSVRLVRDL